MIYSWSQYKSKKKTCVLYGILYQNMQLDNLISLGIYKLYLN